MSSKIPSLETRFQEPPGWRWHSFKNLQGHKIRFGTAFPESRLPAAVIVILPGRTEFGEKYFEIARDLLRQNLSVWILDWQGQGRSHRLLPRAPQRGASPGFDRHVEDLHEFILGYVKHACVHPDVGRIPMVMLAQSTGGNIGLRYLHKYPGMFESAALCAPLLGLKALHSLPLPVGIGLAEILRSVGSNSYAFGQRDWNAQERIKAGATLSGDPVRSGIHDAWMEADPELRVGGATFGWVYHALESCKVLHSAEVLKSVKTPCLIVRPGNDTLVDARAVKRAAELMPNAKLLELPESGHEVLMERDPIRNAFFEAFRLLIKETIIDRPESLKTF